MEKEKVLSWVQKLMTTAMHPHTSKQEVEACQNKAAQLMAKYKISMTEAAQSKESSDPLDGLYRGEEMDFIDTGKNDWGYRLAFGIARAFDCKAITFKGRHTVIFLGYEDDVDTCRWFFDYLQIEIYLWAEKFSNLKKERNSYASGMVVTVSNTLKALYKKVEEIIPSDCLALIVVKKEKVDLFTNEQFPDAKPMKVNNLELSAFGKGLRDGKNLDLSNHNNVKVNDQVKIA